LGACRVCGSDIGTTFAACATETVGPPAVVVAEALVDALTLASVPGAADPLDGVTGEPLDGGRSSITELGATSAADGGTEPTDAVVDAPVAAVADVTD
jgi:hypothetical protein